MDRTFLFGLEYIAKRVVSMSKEWLKSYALRGKYYSNESIASKRQTNKNNILEQNRLKYNRSSIIYGQSKGILSAVKKILLGATF